MTKVYAFDFDGLLVDGLNECVLVSWNGFHNMGIDSFGPDGLEAIPAKFIDTFKNHRNFSRHLGHFVTPFYASGHFKNQEDFDIAYAAIDESIVNSFVTRVNAYRKAARKSQYKLWLEYHSFYRGIEQQLKEISAPIYIVTGKDAASVDEILRHANISIPLTNIFGDNFAYTDSTELEFGIKNRSFISFRAAALENNSARFYGGIHFHPSCIVANNMGKNVGQFVVKKLQMKK